MHVRKWIERISLATLSLSVWLTASNAWAAGAGGAIPWDTTLTTLSNDLTGPVAHAITLGGVVLAGLGWAHSEHGSGMRKASAVGFGGAAAVGAAALYAQIFPFGAALL
ncbi:MAG: TrbC/VirB2 family protein [Deltaproteobacteria bacterium]|nr:TrbC/VirB2 family protein [Deltaproteobacteria bacterium]